MSDLIDRSKPIARQVVEVFAPTIRDAYDKELKAEIDKFFSAWDAAYAACEEASNKSKAWPADKGPQLAASWGVTVKMISDLMAGFEILRAGYLDWAEAATRVACEGLALAEVIRLDVTLWRRYEQDRFSGKDAIRVLRKRYAEIGALPETVLKFTQAYTSKHPFAHSSLAAVSMGFNYGRGDLQVVGGFHEEKLPNYRMAIANLTMLAGGIEGFLRNRLIF